MSPSTSDKTNSKSKGFQTGFRGAIFRLPRDNKKKQKHTVAKMKEINSKNGPTVTNVNGTFMQTVWSGERL